MTLRILAGPFQTLAPLPIRAERFATHDDDVEIVPVPIAWLPREVNPPTHSDLARMIDDARVEVAARTIREEVASTKLPLLLLPNLSRQVLDGAPPGPGRISDVGMLRALQAELDGSALDVRLLALEGLDTTEGRASMDARLAAMGDQLVERGLENVATALQLIDVTHPAFWRAAINRLTRMGDREIECAERLLSGLSADELARAASDPDGRQVLELAPPSGFVLPTIPPSDDLAFLDGRAGGSADGVSDTDGDPVADDREQRLPTRPTRRIDLNSRKVTFVCEKLADRSGGAERVLIELANALCRRGYQVDILSHEPRGVPAFYPLEFGVVHTNLSPRRAGASIKDRAFRKARTALQKRDLPFPIDRLAFTVRYADFHRRLSRYIDAVRPDVLVPFMPPAIVATALAETRHRPRLVASMHNAPEQDFENPARWDPGAYARCRRLELMERMDAIAVLLPQYQQWYAPELRERTTVVPNAVLPVAEDLLDGARRHKTILAVGRLAETKRHDLSLRAFAELATEFPDWNLKIFGVGPLADELAELRDELGLVGRAELPGHTATIADEYLSASILCHAARFEGFPLAVSESLASGLPVVGFADCSGVNSLVVHNENGLLVEPGDRSDASRLAALTDALRRLMNDEAFRTTLGKGGPVSMEPYAPERVVDIWERVLFCD